MAQINMSLLIGAGARHFSAVLISLLLLCALIGPDASFVRAAAAGTRLGAFTSHVPQWEEKHRLLSPPRANSIVNVGNELGTTGQVFSDCDMQCPEMVILPASSFLMGSADNEIGRQENEGPQHEVAFGQSFAIGKYEVTVGQFRAFVQSSGYHPEEICGTAPFHEGFKRQHVGFGWDLPGLAGYEQTDQDPVTCVSWYDAQAYVSWLSSRTHARYILPTEAMWEYAARAGTQTAYFWGNDLTGACVYANGPDERELREHFNLVEWFVSSCSNRLSTPAPVGSYKPNAFGLYDMSGNVREWVQDCFKSDYGNGSSAQDASESCAMRVMRGGSFEDSSMGLRSAARYPKKPEMRFNMVGFRVARQLP